MFAPGIPNALVGVAGVHYVASVLSQRGLIALPTIRNTAGYDIIATRSDGRGHANIQVKTSSKRRTFWLMPPSTKIRIHKNDYYVLLRWLQKEKSFEGFMLTGREARAEVRRGERGQLKNIRRGTRLKPNPSIYIGKKRDVASERWKARWETWRLDLG